jgi:hypothetical protein
LIPTAAPGVTPAADGPVPGSLEDVKGSSITAPAKGPLAELRAVPLTSRESPLAAGGWFDIDLVGTFARAETFPDDIDHPARDRRFLYRPRLTQFEVLQGVFIFMPLSISWACPRWTEALRASAPQIATAVRHSQSALDGHGAVVREHPAARAADAPVAADENEER